MSRVAAIKNAFRPRPPGPLVKYTPEQVLREEMVRMGEPRNPDALRSAVERWITAHPRQVLTARQIRSALSIGHRMSGVRIVAAALRRLCRKGQKRGAILTWTYDPRPATRQPAARWAPAPDLYLADIVISVSIRPRAGAVVAPEGKQRRR